MATRVRAAMTKTKELGGKLKSQVGASHRHPLLQSLPRKQLVATLGSKVKGRVKSSAVGMLGIVMDEGRWDTAPSSGPHSGKNRSDS